MTDTYVRFLTGVKDPKLGWILAQLILLSVPHKQDIASGGATISVPVEHLATAMEIMNKQVGVMSLGGNLTLEDITVDDLVDSHPFFESDVDVEDLSPAGTPVQPLTPTATAVEESATIVEDNDDPFADLDAEPKIVVERKVPVLAEPASLAQESPVIGEGELGEPFPDSEAPEDPFDETPSADEVEVEVDLWGDMDEAEVVPEEDPALDYLKADKMLPFADTAFAGVTDPVKMYEIDSANVSHLGAVINQKDQNFCNLYTQFKGGLPYRYGPVTVEKYRDLLGEAVRKAQGRQDVSVGSMYHHLIKVEADAGRIKCQRLTDAGWVAVLPKADRVAVAKEKHKGK